MPRNYYRIEVRVPRELNHQLELLVLEARERLGRRITKSELVKNIVDDFFSKDPSCNSFEP